MKEFLLTLKSRSSSVVSKIKNSFGSERILDEDALLDLEALLISSDFGIHVTNRVLDHVKKSIAPGASTSSDKLRQTIAGYIEKIIAGSTDALFEKVDTLPHVVLVCGVNGVGKTTTVGKLAHMLSCDNNKVMIAACDTFRAAATEQLCIWGETCNATLFQGQKNSDPASVAHRALTQAMNDGFQHLIIDTAGRMHTESNLMDQLSKIHRVLRKVNPGFPHKVAMVLDSNTGQNAHQQLDLYKKHIPIDGLIITKCDGVSKGGVIVSLIEKHKLPVYYVGTGEQKEDLSAFDYKEFTSDLLGTKT